MPQKCVGGQGSAADHDGGELTNVAYFRHVGDKKNLKRVLNKDKIMRYLREQAIGLFSRLYYSFS